MVNNQEQFNKENPKDKKEIEFKRKKDFQGDLVIEDYSELEKLNLRDNKSVDTVVLKNLPQLQEFTIWDCNTKDLVIENCPQLVKLVIYKNLLTNLEFLKDLEKLETFEINGNDKLTEILKPYEDKGGWKSCQKDIQELSKSIGENPQILSGLREKYTDLKSFLKEVWQSLSKGMQTELMNKLDDEIKSQEQMVSGNTMSRELNTTEIKLGVKKSLEVMKELKEELEEKLVEEKKEQLERLKESFFAEKKNLLETFLSSKSKSDKVQTSLETYLGSVRDHALNPNVPSISTLKEEKEKYLLKEKPELAGLLSKLAEKQEEISLLENRKQYVRKSSTESTQILVKEESSKSEKILAYRNEESETQVGIQISQLNVNIGVTRKDKITTLDEYAQSQQETKLGQILINKELQLRAEEQNQQAQIEQPSKGNN